MDSKHPDLSRVEHSAAKAFAVAHDYGSGDRVPLHRHSVAQLLHTLSGVMLVDTPGKAWAIPPGRGLWLPPGTVHGFEMMGRVSVRTLYIRKPAGSELPDRPFVVDINPLVRELIIRATQLDVPSTKESGDRMDLIVRLALAELSHAPREEFALPLPRTALLKRFATLVRTHPADQRTLDELATTIGTSAKTIARRCISETGLTPDQWRRQARLLAARALLISGRSVTETAAEVGFQSASSFAASFRLAFGRKPSELRRARHSSALSR